jgi:hypothetical protein
MYLNNSAKRTKVLLAATLAASSLFTSPVHAQSAPSAPKAAPAGSPTRYRPVRFSRRANLYYNLAWGIDSLSVKYAESGEMIRFSYRVLDPAKAAILNNRNIEPSLIDPQARVSLVVPALEKVGKLRQSNTPQTGRTYWMAFSNKGRHVRPGHRVTIVVGRFRAEGLVVE